MSTSNVLVHERTGACFAELRSGLAKALSLYDALTPDLLRKIEEHGGECLSPGIQAGRSWCRASGSIASIPRIPEYLRELHRISWEIMPQHVVAMASERAPYIDQVEIVHIASRALTAYNMVQSCSRPSVCQLI